MSTSRTAQERYPGTISAEDLIRGLQEADRRWPGCKVRGGKGANMAITVNGTWVGWIDSRTGEVRAGQEDPGRKR